MGERTCSWCTAPLPVNAGNTRKYCDVKCKCAANIVSIRASIRASAARRRAAMTPEEREQVRAVNRAYYRADPDRYARQRDQWRKDNRERHLELMRLTQSKRRVAKLAGDSRVVTADEWARVLNRAQGCCYYCGRRAKLTVDHVIPLVRGGRHAIGNLVPACERCNKSKGPLLLMEWRLRRAMEAPRPRRGANPRLGCPRVDDGEPGAA